MTSHDVKQSVMSDVGISKRGEEKGPLFAHADYQWKRIHKVEGAIVILAVTWSVL